MPQYKLHALQLTRAADSPVVPVSALGAEPGVETVADESGALTVLSRFVAGVDPRITWTTKQVDRVLSAIDSRGSCIHPDRLLKGVSAYYRKQATCAGDVVTSTSHFRVSMSHGLATPLELSSSGRRGSLVLTGEAHGFAVGGNSSLAVNDAVALPGFTAADKYELKPAAIRLGGLAFATAQSFNLAFGNTVGDKEPQQDGIEIEDGAFEKHDPRLSITARDLTQFGPTRVPLAGVRAENEITEVWFKRRAIGADGFEPSGSPVHARLRMSGLLVCTDAGSGSGGYASTGFEVQSVDDGVHEVLDWEWGIPYAPAF